MVHEPSILPTDLLVPTDDGAADHLLGVAVPALKLPTTTGGTLRVDRPPAGASRLVVYAYSRTGEPGAEPLRSDWDQIPGARGCTPQACDFRDRAGALAEFGAAVAGVSTQHTDYQAEVAARLSLGFPLLSDTRLQLATTLRLAAELDEMLSSWLVAAIEHVGSTAVPGLLAKPVLDLMAAVPDPRCIGA